MCMHMYIVYLYTSLHETLNQTEKRTLLGENVYLSRFGRWNSESLDWVFGLVLGMKPESYDFSDGPGTLGLEGVIPLQHQIIYFM